MRQLYYFSVMLICSILLWNCSKDEENDPGGGGGGKASKLDLSVMEIVFDADGGERTVDVKCDGNWTIETKSDWCTLSMTSGEGNQTITITCPEFVDTDDRNVVFTVKAGDLKVILTVIQKPKDALILDKDKFDVPKEGGTVSILAKSTMECTLFIPEEFQGWISRTPSSKALIEKTFNLTIAECLEYDERVGFVEFSGNGLKDTVYIYHICRTVDIGERRTYVRCHCPRGDNRTEDQCRLFCYDTRECRLDQSRGKQGFENR